MPRPHTVDFLQPEERVELEARRHPLSALDGFLGLLVAWVAVLAILWVVFAQLLPARFQSYGIVLAAMASAAILAGATVLMWRVTTSLYIVTAERVYKAHGRLRFHLLQTTYDKVTDLHIHQSLFGRIWGFGTVRVQTAGTGLALAGVRDPVGFKRRIEAQREAFLHELVGQVRPVRGAQRRPTVAGEPEVRWRGQPVLASLLGGALVAGFFLLAGLVGLVVGLTVSRAALVPAALFMVFSLLGLWAQWIQFRYTHFEVNARGVVLTRGWLSRRRIETTYSKVTDVSVDQDIIARLLRYGRITINTAGGNEAPVVFAGLGDPDGVKAVIDQARREADR